MMNSTTKPVQAHEDVLFVGSIPLSSTEEVFTKVCSALPNRLRSIPDGETGERWNYIGWQIARFPMDAKRLDVGGTPLPESGIPAYTIEDVQPTLYDVAAVDSYAKFSALRKQGVIPKDVLFQVCLPTPYNVVLGPLKAEVQPHIEPLYQKRMEDSLQRIVDAIPHDDLVIQWDMCFEIISLEQERGRGEDRFKPWFEPLREGLLDRIVQTCKAIPSDVKVAFHFCYGDYMHKHFVEPIDTDLVVQFANDVIKAVSQTHHIEWIHLPVPRSRTDAAYFEPLKELKLNGARLYLGLIHANDEEGTRARLETARATYPHSFGVATECGLGRTPKEEIDNILAISKAVTTGHS